MCVSGSCILAHYVDDISYLFFFFFQAEDGIRDLTVTGVRRVLFRSNATPLLWTWYTPNALITRPVVSGTGVTVTVSFVAAYSPAIVNCFDRYESIPRKRLRVPPLVGLPTPA